MNELCNRYDHLQVKYRRINSNRFSASLYKNGERCAQCTVWLGTQSYHSNSIYFSNTETSSENSFNEQVSVENDGYSLHLKSFGMSITQSGTRELTQEGAAEYFWSMFIQYLQQ